MLKKTLGFVLKTLWIIICLTTPTIIIVTYYLYYKHLSFLYLSSLGLLGIGVCITLFVWKKPYSLFALSFGFLITMITLPIRIYLIGGALWQNTFNTEFFGLEFKVIVLGFVYSCPFAFLSFLPAIPAIMRWYQRRKWLQASKTKYVIDSTEKEFLDEIFK